MTLFGNTERKRGDRRFSLRIFRKREASDGHSKPANRRVRAADRDVVRFRPMALFGAGIVIAMLFFAREVFIPLSLAILLSFLLAIPCTFLEHHGFKRPLAVLLLVGLCLATVATIGWVVSAQFYDLAGKLPNYQQTIEAKLASLKTSPHSTLGRMNQMLRRTADELEAPDPKEAGSKVSETNRNAAVTKPKSEPIPVEVHQPARGSLEVLKGVLAPVVKSLATGVMLLVVLIFMLLGREDLRNRVIRLAGTDRMDLTTDALDEAAGRVSRYLLMQLIVNCCFGVLIGLGLFLIGVPNPLLWGAMATLLRFIPYVGAWIAAAAPLLLAFAIHPGWAKLAWTGGLFLTAEVLTGNIIEPLLYGSSTGVSPVALVLSAIFWTWLWGPIGLLLSTPLTVCLAVIGLHVPQLRFLHVLLGDEPVLTPETRFYQRMLAMDRHEVDGIVKAFLKDKTLGATYEQLMLHSLTYAKEDLERGRLTQERETFVLENIGELVEELAEDQEGRTEQSSEEKNNAPLSVTEIETFVAVLPATNRADEIAGTMLAKLLALRGVAVRSLPAIALKEDGTEVGMIGSIRIACISAVPPTGWRRTRYLCKKLRSRFPGIKLLIGYWGGSDNLGEVRESLSSCTPDSIVTTFDEAISAITSLSGIESHLRPLQAEDVQQQAV
jgi:predicted PurR-regulated permease PerM